MIWKKLKGSVVEVEACLLDFNVSNKNNRNYLRAPRIESREAPHIKESMVKELDPAKNLMRMMTK